MCSDLFGEHFNLCTGQKKEFSLILFCATYPDEVGLNKHFFDQCNRATMQFLPLEG
jgi:hypothetical protein